MVASVRGTAPRSVERALGRVAARALLGARGDELLPAGEPATPAVEQAVAALSHPAREQRARALASLLLDLGRAVEARRWR